MVSSIGGNASTNAGGPHCLKYGITVNHVLGLQVVTGAGELVWLGGKTRERPGYDLTGVVVGGEGTLGLVTAVTVRLMHVPEGVKTVLASFSSIEDASEAVSAIIADGIIPAALEMLDEVMIRAIEEGVGAGYPKGAAAVLLIELDGPREEIEAQSRRVEAICRERLALEIRVAKNDAERALLWKGRKEAAGVVGRLTPGLAAPGRGGAAVASCPRSCARCWPSPRATGWCSPTSSTPATATSTRSSATTTGCPTSWRAPSRPTRSCCRRASRWAAA